MENDVKLDSFNENNQNLFDYSISGLGQSDYENEDLFAFEPETLNLEDNKEESSNNAKKSVIDSFGYTNQPFNFDEENELNESPNSFEISQEAPKDAYEEKKIEETDNEEKKSTNKKDEEQMDKLSDKKSEELEEKLEVVEDNLLDGQNQEKEQKNMFECTPIEELNKLTEYTEDKIKSTDINELFDKVGVNVKEASDIFQKNTEMKAKIDARFEELKKLQSEVEKAKKNQIDEINSYKQDVLNKLTEKKSEIEKRLNKLKEYQNTLEKDKQEFEQYKKTQKDEIQKVQKEIQEAYESRREELNHIEDVLRKQKDSLDEERSKLSLDIIQYEADKNELANNLLKFNEIVGTFTNGMDKMKKE